MSMTHVGDAISEAFGGGSDDDDDPADVGTLPEGIDALYEFDDMPVVDVTARITRAGDGLSESMKTNGVQLVHHIGDVVDHGVRDRLVKVTHEPHPKIDGALRRVEVWHAQTVTELSAGTTAALRDQERRNEIARESAKGVQRIPGTEDA